MTDEQKAKVRQYHEECSEETQVDQQKVKMIREGDWSNDDDDLQAYVLCMMMKADLMTADGTFKKDVAMSKLPEDADREKAERAMDTCSQEQGDTPRETAYKMVKSYHFEYPEHSIM